MWKSRHSLVLMLHFILSVNLLVFANSSWCAAAERLAQYQLIDSGADSDDTGTDYDLSGYNSPRHAGGGFDVEFSDSPVRYYRRSGAFLDGLARISIVFQINAESFSDSHMRRIVSRYDTNGQRNFQISVGDTTDGQNLIVGIGCDNGDDYESYDHGYTIPVGEDVWGLVRIDGEGRLLDMLLRDNSGAALGADVIGTAILAGRNWNNTETDLVIGTGLSSGGTHDSRTFDGLIKHVEIYSGLLDVNAFEQIVADHNTGPPLTETLCSDGVDNDADGQTDCSDSDCVTDPACGGDTDGDGMPDWWELQYGLDPLVDDAAGDLDGDGFSNIVEHNYGTDPGNAASKPAVYNFYYDNNGNLEHMQQP